jgi:hypothetical protein
MVGRLEERARMEAELRQQVGGGHKTREKKGVVTEPPLSPNPKAQSNFTDPDSRIMLNGATKSFEQCYNTQNAVDAAHQIIVATRVVQDCNDKLQLIPMVEAIKKETGRLPDKLSADSGYFSEANLLHESVQGIDLYISIDREKEDKTETPADKATGALPPSAPDHSTVGVPELAASIPAKRKGGRPPITLGTRLKKCPTAAAAVVCSISIVSGFAPLQIVLARPLGLHLSPADVMRCKLATHNGKAEYARRKSTVEPAQGQVKEVQNARRFSFRGLQPVTYEWRFTAACHNLLKLWRHAREVALEIAAKRPRQFLPV